MVSRDMEFHRSDLFMKRELKNLKEFNKLWSAFVFSPQSLPKNMKSDLEISPDNEVLDLLGKETPRTPAGCQG